MRTPACGIVGALVLAAPAGAGDTISLATSTFDTSDDGWTLIASPDAPTGTAPQHFDAGGNPGGYIVGLDDALGAWYWDAPEKFLGNKAIGYGGAITFDQWAHGTTTGVDHAADVILVGAGIELSLDLPGIPGGTWTPREAVLDESAGWFNEMSLSPATAEDLVSVLGSLEQLSIVGEFYPALDTGAQSQFPLVRFSRAWHLLPAGWFIELLPVL